jgi:uncharacterized membrane protein
MTENTKDGNPSLPVERVPPEIREELSKGLDGVIQRRNIPVAVDKVIAILSQHTYNESKLPAAHELVALESVVKGGADRAIAMAEKEQNFQISEMSKNNKRLFFLDIFGPALGIIGLCILAALCAFMVSEGYPAAAATSAVGVIGIVVTVFVTRNKADKTDSSDPPLKNGRKKK